MIRSRPIGLARSAREMGVWVGALSISRLTNEGRRSLFAACIAILLALGCHGRVESSPDVVITHELSPEHARVGPATFTLNLKDAAARPVTGAHVVVEADMSHAGMAPVFADAKEVAAGQYRADLRFTMAGDWVLLAHIKLASGETLEREIKVSGVGAE